MLRRIPTSRIVSPLWSAATPLRLRAAASTKASAGPGTESSPAGHARLAAALADKYPQGAFSLSGGKTPLFIDNSFVESTSTARGSDVIDPASQTVRSTTPDATLAELDQAISSAERAFKTWRQTSVLHRQQILFRYQQLIKDHQADIATSITLEQGKTFADAMGDVHRGLQVVESACSLSGMMGQIVEVAEGMDTYVRKAPLGVFASIAPFNFPSMIPLWTIPLCLLTGNTLILKPSPQTPTASLLLAHLAEQAGVPAGVFNIVHGGKEIVDGLLEDPRIKGVSFVGGETAGTAIYNKGILNGKRVQANLAAKNHAVLLPDANKNHALSAILGAAFGAAGQRCMALSVLVVVGEAKEWLPELAKRASELKVGGGFEEGVEVGPLISTTSRDRIQKLLSQVPKKDFLLSGHESPSPSTFPEGNFLHPTIVRTPTDSEAYQQELFGPVLCVVEVATFDEAIEVVNNNRYGNGASLFTKSGGLARRFEKECEAGQLGINVPIPVPLPMFSWSGNKASFKGDLGFYGPSGLNFYTENKTVTSLWKNIDESDGTRASMGMPTLSGGKH